MNRQASVLDENRIVLYKKGKQMGRGYYIIEISSSHTQIFITAFNVERPQSLILEIPEKRAKFILQQFNDDFDALASCLKVANNNKLILLNPNYNPRLKNSSFFRRSKRFATLNNFSSHGGTTKNFMSEDNNYEENEQQILNERNVKTSQEFSQPPVTISQQLSGAQRRTDRATAVSCSPKKTLQNKIQS